MNPRPQIGPIEAAQRARYLAARKKLMPSKPAMVARIPIAAVVAPVEQVPPVSTKPAKPRRVLPSWRRARILFNAHVKAWREHLLATNSPAEKYIRRRAKQLGFTHKQIVAHNRAHEIIPARHQLMWEVKQYFHMSYPQVGALFDRDHTSVIHAVKKFQRGQAQ